MKNSIHIEQKCKETLLWVKRVAEMTEWPEREDWAFKALRAVLHAIRDQTTIEEAFHLSAQLPVLLRGYFFEGYNPSAPKKKLNSNQFLTGIQNNLGTSNKLSAEEAFNAVINVLYDHVSFGEMEEVKMTMPKRIVKLWNTDSIQEKH